MPKKLRFNLILMTFIALPLAMSGCSFRKQPLDKNQTVSPLVKTMSFKEKASSLSNADFIAELDLLSDEELYIQNILDIAIQNKNIDVLTYLVTSRNISPYAYNKDSEEQLEKSPTLSSWIEPYQQATLVNMLIELKKNYSLDKWDEMLQRYQVRSGSCRHLFQNINDWYYYSSVMNTSDSIVQIGETDLVDSFLTLSKTNICKNLKNEFSVQYLNNWLQNELKIQYYRQFDSAKVIELLKTLNTFQDVAIEIPYKTGILRIDPRMLVLASIPFGKDVEKKKYWIELLRPITSTKPLYYNIPYETGSSQCESIDFLCERANSTGIGIVMYWMNHPNMDTPEHTPETSNEKDRKE